MNSYENAEFTFFNCLYKLARSLLKIEYSKDWRVKELLKRNIFPPKHFPDKTFSRQNIFPPKHFPAKTFSRQNISRQNIFPPKQLKAYNL
jgi:hypothetical protein